jgi:integrase
MDSYSMQPHRQAPWNKGRITGQKTPLNQQEIWAIRVRLQLAHRIRDLALFNLAIDSKLRACDLVRLYVADVAQGGTMLRRAIVMQQKTGRPVQFEVTEQTRRAIADWTAQAQLKPNEYLFPSRIRRSPHLSTRQYARIVDSWVADRSRYRSLWHPYHAPDQSDADLSPHQEPASGAAPAWTYEAGEHSAIPQH